MTNLKGIVAKLYVMYMFILLICFIRFAWTSMLMAQFSTVIVQSLYEHMVKVRFSICEQVISSRPRRFKKSLL